MKRRPVKREECIYELSQKNRWYEYERKKKYLNHQRWEVEVRSITKHLKV